jgi:hypothetical protein
LVAVPEQTVGLAEFVVNAPAEIFVAVVAAEEELLAVYTDVAVLQVAVDIAEVADNGAVVATVVAEIADRPRPELVPCCAFHFESVAAEFAEVQRQRLTCVVAVGVV